MKTSALKRKNDMAQVSYKQENTVWWSLPMTIFSSINGSIIDLFHNGDQI